MRSLCSFLTAFLLVTSGQTCYAGDATDKYWLFVGTYTGGKSGSNGIYRLEFDSATGKLGKPELAAEITSPSFLALHPNNQFVYCVNEVSEKSGERGGAISAFSLDASTGELKFLNHQSSIGAGPCHLTADKTGKAVLAANYGGGSTVVLPIGLDGRVGKATGFVQHKGSSINRSRQEGPHAHSVNLDPANRFAFVADLGLDKVLIFKFDADKGTIEPNDPPAVHTAPGADPRHFAFHPTGKFAYVINELDMTVTAFRYDAGKGALHKLQNVPTIPGPPAKDHSTAEVVVHPSGQFLYGSNRGHNTIVGFTINLETGMLTRSGNWGDKIKTPRNFNIDPTGKYLLVGSQDGDRINVFRIDQNTGELLPTAEEGEVPMPVCLRFVKKK